MLHQLLFYKILQYVCAVYLSCYFRSIINTFSLVSLNRRVREQNKLGDTPLHSAAWRGHAEIVKMLLERGMF